MDKHLHEDKAGAPAPKDDFHQQLAEARVKADEYLNAWKRAAADFENYKKRREKEDKELVMFAREVAVVRMLPSLEALEQALNHAPDEAVFREWKKGVEKIVESLDKALKELGVEKVGKLGEKFDHEIHEAVAIVEDKERSGQVVELVAKGYKIDGKVIRPAKVKVAK
jgi:molecular chaperone GrpE